MVTYCNLSHQKQKSIHPQRALTRVYTDLYITRSCIISSQNNI